MMKKPKILLNEEDFMERNFKIRNDISHFIESQWIEEYQQSFHYREDKEGYISKAMERMMKDKSSFWFNQSGYNSIKKDYIFVRK